MNEDFLQYIWANSLLKNRELITHTGKRIEILQPGSYNRDAGPDFFNARLRMDHVILAGNIEVHLKSSDWYRHEHHKDKAYNNVILSVVREDDARIYTQDGTEIECVELEYADYLYNEYIYMRNTIQQPGCYRRLELLEDSWFYLTLQSLTIERLERKVNDIRKILSQTKNDWQECFYRLMCKYWSANINSDSFYQLALYLPYKILLRYIDRPHLVEALLLGCSGLLETAPDEPYTLNLKKEFQYLQKKHKLWTMQAAQWKFMRIRPEGFPTIRLALLAALLCRFGHLLAAILKTAALKEVLFLFDVQASVYWETHYVFGKESSFKIKKLGEGSRKIILINTVIPFLFLYGKGRGEEKWIKKALDWLEETGPENNYIVRAWEKQGFVFDSAMQTQALIQLRKVYCEAHRCLQCRVGKQIFRNLSLGS